MKFGIMNIIKGCILLKYDRKNVRGKNKKILIHSNILIVLEVAPQPALIFMSSNKATAIL